MITIPAWLFFIMLVLLVLAIAVAVWRDHLLRAARVTEGIGEMAGSSALREMKRDLGLVHAKLDDIGRALRD